MKVMTLVGTRPEIIRLSVLIPKLDQFTDHVLVHTGQNWDRQLNEVFFEDLGLRTPDHFLGVNTTSLGSTLGDVITKTETVLLAEKPDAFLVLGDTNSAFGLLMAKRMGIPTYHMEAGNRSFDQNVPEEINRKIVDHSADFNCVYTEHARRNLLAEGLHPRRILLMGSPIQEVVREYRTQIEASSALDDAAVEPRGYFLVSAHRAETVDNPDRLAQLVASLESVADRWKSPVLVSTHPRTKDRLERLNGRTSDSLVRFHPPFGFFDYVKLQMNAKCVLSDSGTISEEASILGFPAVTLRASMERPEALDAGAVTMVDVEPELVLSGVEFAMARQSRPGTPPEYLIENASERVLNFMLSTAPQHRFWSGLR